MLVVAVGENPGKEVDALLQYSVGPCTLLFLGGGGGVGKRSFFIKNYFLDRLDSELPSSFVTTQTFRMDQLHIMLDKTFFCAMSVICVCTEREHRKRPCQSQIVSILFLFGTLCNME